MSEIEIKDESKVIPGLGEFIIEQAKLEENWDFGYFMDAMLPPDTTTLEKSLKDSEDDLERKMKGNSVPAYLEAQKVRDERKQALKNATAMTAEESTKVSVKAHHFLMNLHEMVGDFDTVHGITYNVSGKKTRKSTKVSGGITKAEYDSIPADKKIEGKMEFANGTIFIKGKVSGDTHRCNTFNTWERHLEN